jgi:tRNA(Arg) A34 adenosine deaminase TadA
MTSPSQPDREFIRSAIGLAEAARARGDHPFGALLVGPDGEVLAEAMNTVGTTGDRTGHAERNLMSDVSRRFDPELLAASTMHTSTEPCAMCAASVYWVGVGRVVYGLDEAALRALTGDDPENPTLALPCREVFAAGARPIEVVGPVLPDEAIVPHEGFWSGG